MSKTNMLLFFKSLCIFSFLIITNTSRANEASQSIPTLLKQMDHLLQEREIFVTQKEHKLDSLKHQLALSKSLDDKYKLSTKLQRSEQSAAREENLRENFASTTATRQKDFEKRFLAKRRRRHLNQQNKFIWFVANCALCRRVNDRRLPQRNNAMRRLYEV